MPKRIIIASGNTHKAEEIQTLLGDEFECRTLKDYPNAPEVEEDAATFAGNAVKKALSLIDWLKHHEDFAEGWVLADDSGLEVDALGGAPGVRSARYASGTTEGNSPDEANNAKLLTALDGKPEHQRTARFRCVLALARAGAYGQPELFEGTCEGHIAEAPTGSEGFGYDPLFVPENFVDTFGTLGAEIKGMLSHRAAALRKLKAWLER
tara:strand:+ start:1208 stop:1834 length:627 start_codon:yes stop_codon:yes gene_type:complete